MSVKFESNKIEVQKALNDKAIGFLYDAKEVLVSQTVRNTPTKHGALKRSFEQDSYVDESNLTAYIGSSIKYSVWVELGTGEYALDGKGRKGYWIYVEGSTLEKSDTPKYYTLQEAKRIMAILRNKGLEAFYTNGQKPQRMLYRAFIVKKNKIQEQANKIYRELNGI